MIEISHRKLKTAPSAFLSARPKGIAFTEVSSQPFSGNLIVSSRVNFALLTWFDPHYDNMMNIEGWCWIDDEIQTVCIYDRMIFRNSLSSYNDSKIYGNTIVMLNWWWDTCTNCRLPQTPRLSSANNFSRTNFSAKTRFHNISDKKKMFAKT